jgi:acetylornithine deacetylase/succinyl-diaminopimelate desuccinylase-like protein
MHLLIALLLAATPAQFARQWRVAHEKEIVAELSALVAIPNLASDKVNIERNAAAIAEAFTRRGASVKLLRVEGAPPLVVANVWARPPSGARPGAGAPTP